MKDISVVITAKDRLSDSLKQMQRGVQSLESDVVQYKRIQKEVFEERAKVKLDITDAKQHMQELTREVKSGSADAREAFLAQQEELEKLNAEYAELGKLQREAAAGEKELREQFSKSSNAGSGGILSSLSKAGLGSMLGQAAGDFLGESLTASFGSTIGGAIGSISGNAITGAAIGSIAGPVGAAVGAAVGGLTGAIQSLTEYKREGNELYRTEVQSLYNDSINDTAEGITRGSSIAAEREMYQRSIQNVLGEEMGGQLYRDLKEYGDKTAYDTTDMLSQGKTMLSYGIAGEDVMELTRIIGDIAGGSTDAFSGIAYQISQVMSQGTLQGEDARTMTNWGFNPLEFIAKDQGISTAEAKQMMSAGQVTSDMLMDALRLATSEGERFYQNTEALSDTYDAMMGQLESAWSDLEAAAGESYNATRKEGAAAEIAALTGETKEQMEEAYAMVGAYEAEMENRHQQSIIDAMQAAAERIKEEGLTGVDAEREMWLAKTQAEIDYKNGEEYQMKLAAEQELVKQIQGGLTESGDYLNMGRALAEQFTKGWQQVRLEETHVNAPVSIDLTGGSTKKGHAAGLRRVPYDGYEATLHEGERVLTRVEADKEEGRSISIAKLADSIIVREEADIDKIARALVRNLAQMSEGFVGA